MDTNGLLSSEQTPDGKTVFLIISCITIYSFLLYLFTISCKKYSPVNPDYLFFESILHTFFITIILLIFIFITFKQYICSVLKTPARYFIKGLYCYLLFVPILSFITIVTNNFLKTVGITPQFQKIILLYLKTDSPLLLLLVFFSSCIIAPVAEEIIYRGVIYKAFKKNFSVSTSILLSSAVFALVHWEISVFPAIFFLGITLAFLFEKHENLWACIGLHFFNNFFANLALLIIKFTDIINIEMLNM